MLRSAEDYIQEAYTKFPMADNINEQIATYAINQAQKEALIEASERAKSEWIRYGINMGHYGTSMGHLVDKQSILDIIKEIK